MSLLIFFCVQRFSPTVPTFLFQIPSKPLEKELKENTSVFSLLSHFPPHTSILHDPSAISYCIYNNKLVGELGEFQVGWRNWTATETHWFLFPRTICRDATVLRLTGACILGYMYLSISISSGERDSLLIIIVCVTQNVLGHSAIIRVCTSDLPLTMTEK